MLCLLFLPTEQLHQVRYPGGLLLELAIADDEKSNVGDLGDASLNALWQASWKELGSPRETVEELKSQARKEWQSIIVPDVDAVSRGFTSHIINAEDAHPTRCLSAHPL